MIVDNINQEEVKLTPCVLLSKDFDNKTQGGLRTKNITKQCTQEQPLLTVITVVFNSVICLEETIQSVLKQTYKNIEIIVVDGGSSDGTLEIIKKYDSFIDYWVSEPDSGIYDAMNKGVSLSNGNWINFMNAGDLFFENSTIEKMLIEVVESCDVIYGNTMFAYATFTKEWKASDLSEFWKGMPFIHQSALIRATLQRQHPFNTSLRIAADFDFFLKIYKNGAKFTFRDLSVSVATLGGVSDSSRILSVLERWRVVNGHEVNFGSFIYFFYRLIVETIKALSKKLLPKFLIMKIQKY